MVQNACSGAEHVRVPGPGRVGEFRYSKGMVAYGAAWVVWNEGTLDVWLKKPRDRVKKPRWLFPVSKTSRIAPTSSPT